MKANIIDKIENFLKGLHTDIDILNQIDVEQIDLNDPYNSIYEMIEESGGFNVEIIYYSNAIEYLAKNDNSLRNSLELADEYGYTCKNLNSEILASLCASQNVRIEFQNLQNEIETFFEENDFSTQEEIEE